MLEILTPAYPSLFRAVLPARKVTRLHVPVSPIWLPYRLWAGEAIICKVKAVVQ